MLSNLGFTNVGEFISVYQYYCATQFSYYFPGCSISYDGVTVISVNSDDIFEKAYRVEVGEVLKFAGIENIEIFNRQEIIKLFNFVAKEVIRKIRQRISYLDIDYSKKVLHCLAAYIAEFHGRVTRILDNKLSLEELYDINQFEKSLLGIVVKHKDTSRDVFEVLKGMEKATFQYLYALVLSNEQIYSHQTNLTTKDYAELFLLSSVVIKLISEREYLTSGLSPCQNLKIANGIIQTEEGYTKNFEYFLQDNLANEKFLMNDNSIEKKTLTRLESSFYKEFGFKLSTLEKVLLNNGNSFADEALSYVTNSYSLMSLIENDGACDENEATALVKYLTINVKEYKDFELKTPDKYCKRVFENPIVRLSHGLMLFSYPLLLTAYEVLYRKLIYNLIPECKAANSKIVDKHIKQNHVKRTIGSLTTYTHMIKANIDNIVLTKDERQCKIRFDEVDILAVIRDSLLVIECKDISPSFSATGIRNDISKSIGYIKKLSRKVKSIQEQIDSFSSYFNRPINRLIPIIVFRKHCAVANAPVNKEGVKIFSFETFNKWLDLEFEPET